jgi:hypothetical protein
MQDKLNKEMMMMMEAGILVVSLIDIKLTVNKLKFYNFILVIQEIK